MRFNEKTTRVSLCAAVALAWVGAAQAQANPETGDVAAQSQFGAGVQTQTRVATAPSGAQTTTTTTTVDPAAAVPADDHTAVVGTFGVGFFGVMALPLANCDTTACGMFDAEGTVPAPTIGMRYWLNDLLGIEGALGFHFSSSEIGPVKSSQFGLGLHGGVPLALAHTGHFVFEVVPQLNFGIASGSIETTTGMTSVSADTSGLLIEIGGKVGAEIHFGFIDLPQLSLQGTVGLMIRHESRGAEVPAGAGMTAKIDASTTSISTGVDDAPWRIFAGNISAIYYFGG